MLYERIFREFQRVNLEYAVIGGIAVNLHGYNRITADLDIIISMTDSNIQNFIDVVHALKFVPRLPVKLTDFAVSKIRQSWILDKGMLVFSVYNPEMPLEHIDVKIDEAVDELLASAIKMHANDIEISVVGIDALIQLKRQAGRERDLVDVRALEKIKELT